MTFADLMTLLMCFFVLLLAFSEMDIMKFKQLSGSMKNAFGVQTEIEVKSIPKGTSLIAQEFSPGKPEKTALNEIRQFTVDSNRNTLDALNREIAETREHAKKLRLALRDEIAKGSVAVETEGKKIIIRILENASFDSVCWTTRSARSRFRATRTMCRFPTTSTARTGISRRIGRCGSRTRYYPVRRSTRIASR